MFKLSIIFILGFLITVHGIHIRSPRNYATYSDLIDKCVKQTQVEFNELKKNSKIIVNEKLINYEGFDGKSSHVITLSVSKTAVKLPVLDINYRNMLRLDASYNGLEKIDDFGNETFPSLRLFNLSHNALTTIQSYVFSHLKEVEILDLSHNCFVKFHYDRLFLRHENLKRLYLHDNRLHSIQSTFGEPKIMTLDFVDFSNNFIDFFSNFDLQIKHLKMKNNCLQRLTIVHASEMTLDVAGNKLVQFFAPYGTFKSLNMSGNRFEYLAYIELQDAKDLDLSHNNIQAWSEPSITLHSDEIDDLNSNGFDSSYKAEIQKLVGVRTEKLDLSFNNIDLIQELHHFKSVQHLNLQNNSFANISPPQIITMFPMLQQVNLMNNPLTGDDIKKMESFNSNHSVKFQLRFNYEATTQLPQFPTFLPLLIIPTLLPPITIPTFSIPFAQTTEKTTVVITTMTTNLSPITTSTQKVETMTAQESIIETNKSSTTQKISDDGILFEKLPDNFHHSNSMYFFVTLALIAFVIGLVASKLNSRNDIVYRYFQNEADILL